MKPVYIRERREHHPIGDVRTIDYDVAPLDSSDVITKIEPLSCGNGRAIIRITVNKKANVDDAWLLEMMPLTK